MSDRGTEALAGGALLRRRADGVVGLVLNRPERHNALTVPMYQALLETCAELRDDTAVRAVVIRGAGGRAFTAGNDIAHFTGLRDGAAGAAHEADVRRVLRAVAELPQVTIAVVDGVCAGAGLALATYCDLRIATPDSRFGYPIARTLGNVLAASMLHRCVAVFGESLTREMVLTSRLVDAARAHAVGAVMSVVPEDRLDREVEDVVAGLRLAAQLTLRTTKRQLLHRADTLDAVPEDDDSLIEQAYGSADFREGVRAFLARREPNFGRRTACDHAATEDPGTTTAPHANRESPPVRAEPLPQAAGGTKDT
ncbi:enoyl-CoA hydratase-related protein [Streptomyces sp. NPDC052042]|uniref:enoyl-CoA hydratase-related protein n=1 Tax=Streptomyces sp. NPDC052042 TaxID=3365683 RepID=UPI0037CFEF11